MHARMEDSYPMHTTEIPIFDFMEQCNNNMCYVLAKAMPNSHATL